MHRSGTSVLTDLLARLGAAAPNDPNPPAPDNPRGYWEPAGLVRLHDLMLFAADSAWLDTRPLDLAGMGQDRLQDFSRQIEAALDASFGTAACFALKDPRICRFVPFYRDLFARKGIDLKVVLAVRAPIGAAASLFARNQISHDYTGILWAHHLLEAERHTRDLPRIVVAYEALMSDWQAVARRLGGFLAIEGRAVDTEPVASPVDPDLHHHRATGYDAFDPPLGALLGALHATLESLSRESPLQDGADASRLDGLARQLAAITERQADLLTIEFCFQRLTSPYDTVGAPDPLRERQTLATSLERLRRARQCSDGRPAGQ